MSPLAEPGCSGSQEDVSSDMSYGKDLLLLREVQASLDSLIYVLLAASEHLQGSQPGPFPGVRFLKPEPQHAVPSLCGGMTM